MLFAKIVEYAILGLLAGLSVFSLAIMFDRYKAFKQALNWELFHKLKSLIKERQWGAAVQEARQSSDLTGQTLIVAAELPTHTPQSIGHGVNAFLTEKRSDLEKGLTALATLGSNAPFIGLFGTVVGIIRAFAALSEDQAGSASVMSGISVALVATAAGLAVAIPAVIAFNWFQRKLDTAISTCESLRDLFIAYKINDHGSE